MKLRRDIWRPAIVRRSLADLLAASDLHDIDPIWLPNSPRLRFLADPFGFMHDGELNILAEAYDYRDRHGIIERLIVDDALQLKYRRIALREPWHLSYPITIVEDAKRYMLPEAFRSGGLRLYRMGDTPETWTLAAQIVLDAIPIDATPWFDGERWWLFYAPAGTREDRISRLHVAWSKRLAGPWHTHPGNPVRRDPSSSRPGGTVVVIDGHPVLPVQDCVKGYGAALRALHVTRLTPDRFEATCGPALTLADAQAPWTGGLHTASTIDGASDLTLIDAKRLSSPSDGLWATAHRLLRRRR